jgi:hypothetical protein
MFSAADNGSLHLPHGTDWRIDISGRHRRYCCAVWSQGPAAHAGRFAWSNGSFLVDYTKAASAPRLSHPVLAVSMLESMRCNYMANVLM